MRLAGQLLQSEPIAIEADSGQRNRGRPVLPARNTMGGPPPDQVAEGTPIGEYTVHYDDGSVASIPILYGRDVRDWVDHGPWSPHRSINGGLARHESQHRTQ